MFHGETAGHVDKKYDTVESVNTNSVMCHMRLTCLHRACYSESGKRLQVIWEKTTLAQCHRQY